MKQYTKKDVEELSAIIRPMAEQRTTSHAIAEHLNSIGLKTKHGKKWTGSNVCYFISDKMNKKPRPTQADISRLVIEALVTEPTLNDKQRVNMIRGYLNA